MRLCNICRIHSRQRQQKGKDTGLRRDLRDHGSGCPCLDGSRSYLLSLTSCRKRARVPGLKDNMADSAPMELMTGTYKLIYASVGLICFQHYSLSMSPFFFLRLSTKQRREGMVGR